MSELSKLLGAAAPPHQITHEGRTYTFHVLDQPRKNAIEKRLYQRARECVYLDREHMSSEEYTRRLEEVRQTYEKSGYSFYSKHFTDLLGTERGAMLLLEVLTGETEEDLVALMLARPEEVKSLIRVVLEESVSRLRGKKSEAPNG